jgi:MSHA pilin protein MshA
MRIEAEMKTAIPAARQGGFTLVELVTVIAVLGILAATAMPKMMSLNQDARIAVVQAAKGALHSTTAMVHARYLAKPGAYGDGAGMPVEDATVTFRNGYPSANGNLATVAGLDDQGKYRYTWSAGVLTVSPQNVADRSKCNVSYTEAGSTDTPPLIALTVSDCS